jgi:hypothetical protein
MSTGNRINDSSLTDNTKAIPEESPAEAKSLGKLHASSILQGLLDKHRAQSLVVESLKEELKQLEQNPGLYFQNRKKFLYHGYTQTLAECQGQMKFDVKVR